MKVRVMFIFLLAVSFNVHAEAPSKETLKNWYQSAKTKTEKVLEVGKKSAGEGLQKTTDFVNKTGEATKEGLQAFKRSFNKADIKNQTDKLPAVGSSPAYLTVKGYKACIAIKNSDATHVLCLPKHRALMCEKAVYQQLKSLKSPESC